MKRNKPLLERIVSNWPAKALSLAAAVMLFLFHNFATLSVRYLSVDLEARFADGFTSAQQYPRKVRVVVRGRENNLSTVIEGDIEAVADFSRFFSEGVYKTPIIVSKRGNLERVDPLEIRVEPLELNLRIERKARKSVEVVPNFKGFPAPGYELEQYFVNPSRIDVEGPAGLVQNITSTTTEDIDLTGKTGNFTLRARLVRENPLFVFPGGDIVDFRGQIKESTILKSFDTADIVALDLRPDLRIDNPLPRGTLRVQGGQLLLEDLRPDRVRLIVDCSGITLPGIYTLPVKTDLPQGIMVLNYTPVQVTLEIRPRGRQQ